MLTKIIGGAGTGKTTRLMEILESLLSTDIEPHEIGFASFTKIAVTTAAARAGEKFSIEPELLTEKGWFRTLHSACYHILSMKQNQMLSDDKRSKEWIQDCFGMELDESTINAETGFTEFRDSKGGLSKLLDWWAYTRNTLSDPYYTFEVFGMDQQMTRDESRRMVDHYERRKRRDGMRDFCDLPLAVAGLRVEDTGIEYSRPAGEIPRLKAWIIDEYQDTSPALHQVAKRLIAADSVERVYISADPFQAIFSFGGGNPRHFNTGFKYTDEIKLQQSYRCSPPVMEYAEGHLKLCTDYFDRGIKPRESDTGGVYTLTLDQAYGLNIGKTDESWLLIARTNKLASRLTSMLNRMHIPWDTTVGGTYLGIRKRNIAQWLTRLRTGGSITPSQWTSIVTELPAKLEGEPCLARGVKTQALAGELEGLPQSITMANLEQCGAHRALITEIAGEQWFELVNGLDRFENARKSFGLDAVLSPKVRVGTIHSVKGDEADNVLLYNAISRRCQSNLSYTSTSNEERRVWYVGASRARENLYVGHFRTDKTFMY